MQPSGVSKLKKYMLLFIFEYFYIVVKSVNNRQRMMDKYTVYSNDRWRLEIFDDSYSTECFISQQYMVYHCKHIYETPKNWTVLFITLRDSFETYWMVGTTKD